MTKPGTIHKISIKDFVTYSEVVLYPGPNLNIVIGPNGTGKSTIVAAIILGLGGSPKTIGRGAKVSEYVKHDCTEATINIELYGSDPGKIIRFTRKFNINNHNIWHLNGKQVNEHEIKNVALKLNIQVNNLCQFLPQDRVQDFAKMDKKELLLNTQKAVGRQDLVDKHAELIKIRNEQNELCKNVEHLTKKLNQAKDDISRLEGKVQNLQEKKKIKTEIDYIKRKISWENYNKALKTKAGIEDDLNQAEKLVNRQKRRIHPVETKIKALQHNVSITQNTLLQTKNNLKTAEMKVKRILDSIENINNSHRSVIVDMQTKMKALAEFENEIDIMKAKIDKLVNDENSLIKQYGEEKTIEDKAAKLLKAGNLYQAKYDEKNREKITALNVFKNIEKRIFTLTQELQIMENVKEKRMQILFRRDKDAYDATLWLRQNKHLFKGNVYEPVMVEINVLEPNNCKYLENIVPMRDRVAFTCECRQDMNLFVRTVKDGLGLKINVVHSGPEHPPLAFYKPPFPIEQLRKFGFFAYMSSLIQGPESIIKYLCKMYAIHNIPIGDRTTNSKASHVPQAIRLFFSDTNRYAVMSSRYTGQKSSRISNVMSDGTFSICLDVNSMNQMRIQLETVHEKVDRARMRVEELEAQKTAYENKQAELMRERENLIQQKEQIKILKDKRELVSNTLDNYIRNHKSAEQIKQEANKKIKNIIKKSSKYHISLLNSIQELDTEFFREKLLKLELSILHNQITFGENQIEDLRGEWQSVQATYNEIKSVYETAVQDVQESLTSAKKLSDGFTPSDSGFNKYRQKHDSLSSNIEELNGILTELQAKTEFILTADDGELKQYEMNQKLFASCQEELTTKEVKMNQYMEKTNKLYKEWITPLQDVVDKINKNFGLYFESMQCSGEVSISHDSPTDYNSYGMSIRVTYRSSEPLQDLNRYVQSGGERAVATAVYMLAMQDLTAAPFRCVDEINQGMDPQNERRIFEILVQVAGRKGTGQYFLITPKLIPALQFGDAMSIHIVHNGPFCDIGEEFMLKKCLLNLSK